jgi:hypothetical protein
MPEADDEARVPATGVDAKFRNEISALKLKYVAGVKTGTSTYNPTHDPCRENRNPTLCRVGNVTAELHGRDRKVTLASQYFSAPASVRVREIHRAIYGPVICGM